MVDGRGGRTGRGMLGILAIGLLGVALRGSAPAADLGGAWHGTFAVQRPPLDSTASGVLIQAGTDVSGTLTLDAAGVQGSFAVIGATRGRKLRLVGVAAGMRLRWRARWSTRRSMWIGPAVVRAGQKRRGGRLTLTRGGFAPACGADYFASDVMPRVCELICAQCHVQGGQAAQTRFRVTGGDPSATSASAVQLVDFTNPAQSLLLLKPRAAVAHGGGLRLAPGTPEDQTLSHWVDLVTAPGCGSGGGGGGGGTGADLYAASCASCHGADARGLESRPDVRCNRQIHDSVRNGTTGPTGVMPAFPNLSDADIALIQDYLGTLCPVGGASGADRYAGNCATCHGSDARGASGPNVRCNRRIHDPVRNGVADDSGTMPAFPLLLDSEIALVQSYLAELCPPGGASGADLYAGNCATCHGTEAGGVGTTPGVRCATRVADAVQRGRATAMPSFPDLVAADLASLTAYLGQLCTAHGRSGSDLYAGNCATCHGADAGGGRDALGVRGPSISCGSGGDYLDAIRQGEDKMPTFPALSSADVDAMVSFVHGSFCPGG